MSTPFYTQSSSMASWADDDVDDMEMPPVSYTRKDEPTTKPVSSSSPEPLQEPKFNDYKKGGSEYNNESSSHPVPNSPPFTCYVGNLPYEVNNDSLTFFFKGLEIKNIRLPMDYNQNRPKGFAYVEFESKDDMEKSLSMNGYTIANRPVRIDVAAEKKTHHTNAGGNHKKEYRKQFSAEKQSTSTYHPWDEDSKDSGVIPEGRKKITLLPRGSSKSEDDEKKAVQKKAGDEDSKDSGVIPEGRKKITLLPRGSSKSEDDEKKAVQKKAASIFGDAKPRDESTYVARKKSMDEETTPKKEVKPTTTTSRERKNSIGGGKKKSSSSSAADTEATWGHTSQSNAQRPRAMSRDKTKKKKKPVMASGEELLKKAHVSNTKVATKVTNAFAALDSDSSDSD